MVSFYTSSLSTIQGNRLTDSELIHVDALGSHFIIVNSAEAATELLDKRSSQYSDRYRESRRTAAYSDHI